MSVFVCGCVRYAAGALFKKLQTNSNNWLLVLPGAKFTRHAEVQFYPGNHRLSILQTGRGLDEHNLLNVDTVVSGNVPFIPPEAEITVEPFKETYQYYPSGNHGNTRL